MIRTLLAIAVCCAPARVAAELIVEGPTRIAGDGQTAVVFKVRSDRVEGGELEARPTAGVVRSIRKTSEGFDVELVPPRVVEQLDVWISMSLTGSGGSDRRTHQVVMTTAAVPSRERSSGGPFDLRGPDRVYLGDDASVAFSVDIVDRERPPVLVASAGQLSELVPAQDGRLSAIWTPPSDAFPHVLFVAALSGDDDDVDTLVVPLNGRGRVRLKSEPQASVTVRVGDVDFGPVTTDSQGRAELAVSAPPGIDVANTVAKDPLGNETLGQLRLGAPAFSRVFAACPIAGDRVIAMAVSHTGEPVPSADLQVQASSGSFGAIEALGPGVFQARLSSVSQPEDLELSATLGDDAANVSRCSPPSAPGLLATDGGYMVVVRGGYLSNLGRIDGPVIAGDAAYRFPLQDVRFSLGIFAGVIVGFDSADSAGMDPETIRTQILTVPIMAQFSIGVPIGRVTPYLSGGAGIALARATVSSRSADIRRSATRPAARGGIGVTVSAGSGAIVAEIAYLHATLDEAEIRGRIGGLHFVAGYGWMF